MEHLLNCHGELAALIPLVETLPFAGQWLRFLLHRRAHAE